VVTAVGKPAIDKYWRNRRANVFETIFWEWNLVSGKSK
jgi:hypothetical protein